MLPVQPLETVRIVANEVEAGYIIINLSDLQEDDVLFDAGHDGKHEGGTVADMTVVQLREVLKAAGVQFPSAANKAELVALVDALPDAPAE